MMLRRIPFALVMASCLASSGFARADEVANEIATIRQTLIGGDGDGAQAAAKALAAQHPNDAKVLWLYAEVLDAVGDDDVDQAIAEAVEKGRNDATVLAAATNLWIDRFATWIASDAPYDAPRARAEVEKLLPLWRASEPRSSYPLLAASRLLEAAGENARALGFAQAAVARDTSNVDSHTRLWNFLGGQLDFETLAGFYEALAQTDLPADERARCVNYQSQVLAKAADAWRASAVAASEANDESRRVQASESAVACYRRAIECAVESGALKPEWQADVDRAVLAYHVGMIGAIGALGDFARTRLAAQDAQPILESALRANPADEQARRSLEWIADAIYRSFGADENHERGMSWLCDWWTFGTRHVTDNAEWFNNIGFCGRQSKRYEESYAAYEKCIALSPDSVRYVNDTGLILLYHLHRDLEHAHDLFQRAVELGRDQYQAVIEDPIQEPVLRSSYGDALLNLGLMQTREKRFDEAAATLAVLDELEAARVDLLAAKVDLAVAQGDLEGARRLLGRALEGKDRPSLMTLFAVDETLDIPAPGTDEPARTQLREQLAPLLAPYRNR